LPANPFHMSVSQLQHLLGATPMFADAATFNATVWGISTDSRQIQPGNAFVALVGEKFDGHHFLKSASEQGAKLAVVQRADATVTDLPQLVVADTLQAYQAMARWWGSQFAVPTVAITGSVGKTTTKELLAALLQTQGRVLKSAANDNNEIGVPKTLLQLSSDRDFVVLEMAMRGRGQIAELASIARPDVGIITTVGTAHIGLLGSREAIAEAKCELLEYMNPEGTAILNADNDLLMATAAGVWQGKTVTFGWEKGDFRGRLLDPETLEVSEGTQDSYTVQLPIPGAHNATNFLAVLAAARVLQARGQFDYSDWKQTKVPLQLDLPPGRAQRYTLPQDILVLDETYNAGTESMVAALQLLAQTPGKRRIAVLGTMKELGSYSLAFHRQVGETAASLQVDALWICADDPEAQAMREGARNIPHIVAYPPRAQEQLLQDLLAFLEAGDRILLKASHAVGLDRLVKKLRFAWEERNPHPHK